MCHLRSVRVGEVWVTPQLPLTPEWAPVDTAPWTTLVERERGATFVALPIRSALNSPTATGMGFWSLNPYIGCEFGCTYCYARRAHRYVVERARRAGRLDAQGLLKFRGPEGWEAFERKILIKREIADVLARTLAPAKMAGHTLVIGTATDPYQPAEQRFGLTRRVLEVLLRHRGLSIGLITKSPLVTRDLHLFQRLSTRHDVSVSLSIAMLDARLARRLELRSPAPRARLRALRVLTAGGIHAGVFIAPILPGITDRWAGLAALMTAAKEAGARYVVGSALRLNSETRHRFLPFLMREFPELAERYHRCYDSGASPRPSYADAVMRRFRALQQIHGFPVADERQRQPPLAAASPRERQEMLL
jgi:DNA repair photolyase